MKNKKQNHIDCYSKNGEIINKNKKEIDVVVEILEEQIWDMIKDKDLFTNYWHPADKDLFFKEIANSILTKLRENEIVLAEGEINVTQVGDYIGGKSVQKICEKYNCRKVKIILEVEDGNNKICK